MGNRKTPLIKQLRKKNDGGTLYIFPSASEDIGLNLNSTVNGVALTHYALLDIPPLSIDALLDPFVISRKDANVKDTEKEDCDDFAKVLTLSLQNYMMNFETVLVNDDNYSYQELKTVSEKVFWHWAKKIGILKKYNGSDNIGYKKVSDDMPNIYYDTNHNSDSSTGTEDINKLIKCFGSIDAGNSLSTEFGIFNETYINIPTSYGSGPVYLKSSEDANYKFQRYYSKGDILAGRDKDTIAYQSYLGYDIPFYDGPTQKYYNTADDEFEGLEIVKDLPTIERIIHKNISNTLDLNITSYDDINVDITQKLGADIQFNFNAILLYYSVYDQNDIIKSSQATNLFGIIFLDGVEKIGDSGRAQYKIPSYTKTKSTNTGFGNSYSFRVNLKTMSVYDNTDAVIQDNTTMSSIASVDFSGAISQLNRAIDIMNTNVQATAQIQNNYASIITYYDNQQQDINALSNKLDAYIKGERSAIMDTSLLYVNKLQPNVNNESNNISFSVREDDVDEFGNIIYTEPKMIIDRNGVNIEDMYITNQYINQSYIYHDVSINDLSIFGDITNSDVSNAQNILDLMFGSTDNLHISIVKDSDYSIDNAFYHNKIYNQSYIDPRSLIFTKEHTEDSINYLVKRDGNMSYPTHINYVGFIPYMIAQLQKLTIQSKESIPYIYDKEKPVTSQTDIHTLQDAISYILYTLDNIGDIYELKPSTE